MKGESHDNEIILTARLSAGSMSTFLLKCFYHHSANMLAFLIDQADINIPFRNTF